MSEELKQETQEEVKEKEDPISIKDPQEFLAQELSANLPIFKAAVDKLSNRSLRRVIKAIVEVPLNNTEYKPTSQEEKFTFMIADRILQAKFMLMLHTYSNHLEELEKAKEDALKASENKEGESNGEVKA